MHELVAGVGPFFQWFAGGSDHPYHTLFHCMMGDRFWAFLTVGLDVTIAAGYAMIAWHWWKNQRISPNTPAKKALRNIRDIFIFCAVCGYVFIPVKMVWPAWRLYDMFLAVLAYSTWRYVLRTGDFKVIYNELGQSHRLKEELERSRRESRQKTFFLNALSHDLRTPLNGLLLQAHVARIAAKSRDAHAVDDAIAEIENGARAAADLLDRLLQCARLDWVEDPTQMTEFSLDVVIKNVLIQHQAQATGKGLTLALERSTSARLRTDKLKLERILGNLVANAVKFTHQGGVRIVVETGAAGLEIHVIDTGIGIAPEAQAHVFDEFYQEQNSERDRNKGFGLGLSIARRMARQLGGDIEVHSDLGAGTRFTLVLAGVVVDGASDAAPFAHEGLSQVPQSIETPVGAVG